MKLLRGLAAVTAAIAALGLSSCGGSSSPPTQVGDFTLNISSQSVFVPIGPGGGTVKISIQPEEGFNQPVAVLLSGLPAGVTATPASPFQLEFGGSQIVVLTAPQGTSPVLSTMTVTALAGTSLHRQDVTVSVAAAVYAYLRTGVNLDTIVGYSADANTGTLTQLQGSQSIFPSSATFLGVSTGAGAFLYGKTDSTLFTLGVDPATGAIAQRQVIPDDGLNLAVSPDNKFLYVTESCIRAYVIDPATGNLTSSSCSPVPALAFVLVPPGNVAYAFDVEPYPQTSLIYLYSVDRNRGSLTVVQSAPSPLYLFGRSWHAVADPQGQALYVLEGPPGSDPHGCGQVEALGIDQTMNLTYSGLLPQSGCIPWSMTFDPASSFGYLSSIPGTYFSNEAIDGLSCESLDV